MINIIGICSRAADKVSDNESRTDINIPGVKIISSFEKYNLSRISCRSYYKINSSNQAKYIGKEEYTYRFISRTSCEERCISKIYDSNDDLLAYKFYDKFTKYQFFVGLQKPKDCLSLIKINCNYGPLQETIRKMEIEKLRSSIPFECSQRKSEMSIIMHAYQIIGQKKNSYILPINNDEKKGSPFYELFQNTETEVSNEEFINILHLTERTTKESEFIILPLKINHHCSTLVINLLDSCIYCLDSMNGSNFDQFHFIRVLKYSIQRYYTCAYFMEAMCIVLSQYEHVSSIIKECKNGVFIVKTLNQFGLMFEHQKDRTVVLSDEIDKDKRYHEIAINTEGGLFKYKIKKILSNSKFFNFKEIMNLIDPESQHPNSQDEIKKFEYKFAKTVQIHNHLNDFYDSIDKEVENKLSTIKIQNLSKHDLKHLINDMQNECQLIYKTKLDFIISLSKTSKQ